MADNCIEYNETTDLYLRMLREAQKVEDKKLIGMIQKRLRQLRQPIRVADHGNCVITVPEYEWVNK